ncbi:extracellular solute-binding protein [Permianibacter sp. IMCC34836]|uniref:extracellular solute-binding protein n=1 Tax=Permianibacter fluminis TaxID=2738515 RepID=UPI001553B286|nr:extracellular solute-binding protein [Permianibacter fluminis]NQD38993.1 extracellular solute-binding protein [Permianibacter fluminis]
MRPSCWWLLLAAALPVFAKEPATVRVYNWTDYIDESVLKDFTDATGIRVEYETFESAEDLEGKIGQGKSGYDVVVPSANFLAYGRRHKLFQPLDKTQLSNLAGLDAALMRKLERSDPSNEYGVPYLWGTTIFAYRAEAIAKRLGANAATDSWQLLLNPGNLAKLSDCGVAFLDSGIEVMPELLRHIGSIPNSLNPSDYMRVEKHLKQLVPHVRYFGGENIIDDLASGKLCAAYTYSGDLAQARDQAAANGITDLTLVLPKEGADLWVDLLAIPIDAPHPQSAHAFINFLLQPAVMARISNAVSYPNAVTASLPLIDEAVRTDPVLFPSPEAQAKLYTLPVLTDAVAGISERIWKTTQKGKSPAGG